MRINTDRILKGEFASWEQKGLNENYSARSSVVAASLNDNEIVILGGSGHEDGGYNDILIYSLED